MMKGYNQMVEVLVAIITGVLTLSGTVVTVIAGNRKTSQNIEINQAVTNEKITELTREVREHNNFARRLPVVEEQIKNLSNRVQVLEVMKNGK